MNPTQPVRLGQFLKVDLDLFFNFVPWIGLLVGVVLVVLAETVLLPSIRNRRLLQTIGMLLAGVSVGYLGTRFRE